METKEHESNWTQACRAFGFDWPGIVRMNTGAPASEGSGGPDECGAATSHDTAIVAAFRSGQTSAKET